MNLTSKTHYIISYLLDLLILKFKKGSSVFSRLAVTSLLCCCASLTTPLWQTLIELTLSIKSNEINSILVALFFLSLTFLFSFLSKKYEINANKENIINSNTVCKAITIGNSKIFSYCGSIIGISGVDVIVTSENKDLTLGSMHGTSVSGRVRRLAASFNIDGTIASDPLNEFIQDWKLSVHNLGPYKLGTTIIAPAFNASSRDIRSLCLAVALEKKDTGDNLIDENAIKDIIEFVSIYCIKNSFNSIFIPVFGLGSGNISQDVAINATVNSIVDVIRDKNLSLSFYVGTYRTIDSLKLITTVMKNA
ncbi:hypothetical protein ACP6EV_06455 [Aeromonas hydrophila]|uniref:hypothetical protein n=1 Tax=Aeromonas hydrophila TaxID=644 RepID=UPI003CE851E0